MSSNPRGSYRNGIRTRDQIIAEAMDAFAERGFHGLSMRQVATAVGISPAAIRRHFDSKDDLLIAVFVDAWARETANVQRATGGEPAGLALWSTLPQVMDYHTHHQGLLRLFIRLAAEATFPEHPARDRMAARYRGTIDRFAGALLDAAEAGDIRPLSSEQAESEARALVAFLDGIEIQWLLDPSFDMAAESTSYLAGVFARLSESEPQPVS